MLALLLGVCSLLAGCQEEAPQAQNTATTPLAAPAEGELAALRAQIEALQTELEKQRDALRAVDDRLDIRFRAVSDAVTAVAASLRTVSGTVDGLGAQMQAISTSTDDRIGQINTRLATTAATLAGLRSDVDAQQLALWSLQSDVAAAQATANDAAALAATWPAAVSAWTEGRYVRRIISSPWRSVTFNPPAATAGTFFGLRRYSFSEFGIPATGLTNGTVLLDVALTYAGVTSDPTAGLWLCAGGGSVVEARWKMPSVDAFYGCSTLPIFEVDRWAAMNSKDARFIFPARMVDANSFALRVTGNTAFVRDLLTGTRPVYVNLRPIAWFPDDP